MLFAKLARRWRWLRLKMAGADVAYDIQSQAPFFTGEASGFKCGGQAWIACGAKLIVGQGATGAGRLTLGDRIFINHYAIVDCHCEVTIGNDVMIGPHAYIGDFDHVLSIAEGPAIGRQTSGAPVRIADHVWIGTHAVVLKGVSIGAGAVIAAGAVVTRDVPSMGVVGGVPARLLRMRDKPKA